MILSSSGILGLALGNRCITCAELSLRGDRRSIRRMAVFNLPAETGFDQGAAVGQMLARFLRQNRFRATRAVVGVPARWLMAVEREVPPADAAQVAGMLRMHAERISGSETGEMVFDYAGHAKIGSGGKVLLVGILRQQLDQIETLLDAAGIGVIAVTSASLVLATRLPESADQPVLVLGRQDAEVVWARDGAPRLLRHLALPAVNGHDSPALGSMGAELRRLVALTSANGGGPVRELLLWDGLGLTDQHVSELTTRLGVAVRSGQGLDRLGVHPEEPSPGPDEDGPPGQFAASVALAGVTRADLPLDFKHSRLTPPRKRQIDRRVVLLGLLGLVLVFAVASLYWGVRQRQSDLEGLQRQLDGMAGDIKSAEKVLDRVTYARGYFDARPPMLDCLREVTLAFRDDEPIWVTGFTLRENGKGQLVGKAADQKTILQLCDRLQQNSRLSDVRTLQISEVNAAGSKSKEQSFAIAFTVTGSE
jgi:hypothetical protein